MRNSIAVLQLAESLQKTESTKIDLDLAVADGELLDHHSEKVLRNNPIDRMKNTEIHFHQDVMTGLVIIAGLRYHPNGKALVDEMRGRKKDNASQHRQKEDKVWIEDTTEKGIQVHTAIINLLLDTEAVLLEKMTAVMSVLKEVTAASMKKILTLEDRNFCDAYQF